MNLFDGIKRTAFRTTTSVMGYDCSWLPSDGSLAEPLSAKVHYSSPAKEEELTELGSGVNQMGFMPQFHSMEYLSTVFPGLKDSVRGGGSEYVIITQFTTGVEVGKFKVRQVDPIHDGDTFKADLVPVEEIPSAEPTDEDEYIP